MPLSRLLVLCLVTASLAKRPTPSNPPLHPRSPLRSPAELVGSKPTSNAAALRGAFAGGNALPAVALVTALPCLLALWKQAYAFTYSYGLSMALVGGALLLCPPVSLSRLATAHVSLLCMYGVRLVAFLAHRQWSWKGWSDIVERFEDAKMPIISRLALAASVSLFYALLCAPALFHAQRPHATSPVTAVGLALAAISLTLETVADAQKSAYKLSSPNSPMMSGLFSFVRHANYLGECGFWLGSYIAALPAIAAAAKTSVHVFAAKLLTSTLGLAGITTIMLGASKRLDSRQMAKYGQRPDYQAYRKRTGALLPKLHE